MKCACLLATLISVWPAAALGQTADDLINDGRNTEYVTTESLGYDRKNYSPLEQINRSNVKRLVPIWSTSLMNDAGELAAPSIYDGVMYVVNGKWTFALDVATGRQIWRTLRQFLAHAANPEARTAEGTGARHELHWRPR